MSMAEIESEIDALAPKEQDRLAAKLTAIRLKRENKLSLMTQKLDDPETKWVQLKDFEKSLVAEK